MIRQNKKGTVLIYVTVLLFFHVFIVFSQDSKKQVQEYQKRLRNTKSEIKRLRDEVEKQKEMEKTSLESIANIDKENNLIQKYLRQLKTQETQLRKNIILTNNQLLGLQGDQEKQKEIYMGRLIHFYKHRRLSDLEILLTSKSINQALVYLKYRKRIAETDQRRLKNLVDTKDKIETANKSKRDQLSNIESLGKEKSKEEINLAKRRKEKEEILKDARSKKDFYLEQVKNLVNAQKELQKLIGDSERRRISSPIDLAKPTQFTKLKGKMTWPVKGKIINKFGKVIHPVTKQPYLNDGIDIKASFGEEVKSTCSGVITQINWQRTWGNFIIVNHYGGYYTIYTHLSEIHVSISEEVRAGQTIGLVGDSGSISGAKLHFQVWHKKNVINPLNWLSRKPS